MTRSKYEYRNIDWDPNPINRYQYAVSNQQDLRLWKNWVSIELWIIRIVLSTSLLSAFVIFVDILRLGNPVSKVYGSICLFLVVGVPVVMSITVPLVNWVIRYSYIKLKKPQSDDEFQMLVYTHLNMYLDRVHIMAFREAIGHIYGVDSNMICSSDTSSQLQRYVGLFRPFAFELVLELDAKLNWDLSDRDVEEMIIRIGEQATTIISLLEILSVEFKVAEGEETGAGLLCRKPPD